MDVEERGQEGMKGGAGRGAGMASVQDRKENDCVRVSVGAQPPLTDSAAVPLILSDAKERLFIQSFRDARLQLYENSYPLFLSCNIATPSSSSTVLVGNAFMWAHFLFSFFFCKINVMDSSPHASSF